MKIKAVVLEKSGSRYTVLDEKGSFRHVHKRQDAEVGEEIEIQLASLAGFGGLRVWAGVAAVFLLVLTTLFAWNLYQAPTAVAMLSVDINPSIQFSIDEQGNLLKINTKNEDADRLLNNIELKGKPIDKVLEQIVTEAYAQSFLNPEQPWIVVGYSPLITDTSEGVGRNLNENQIVSWVKKDFEGNGFTPQVAFFTLTPQDRELAQNEKLTLGEYALWQTAVKAGVDTQPDKLKDTLERVQLLENPKVQAQVRVDKKNIESPSPTKGQTPDEGKGPEDNKQQQKWEENQKKNRNTSLDKDKELGELKDKGLGDKDNDNNMIKEKPNDKGADGKGNGAHTGTGSDKTTNNGVGLPSFLRIGNPSSIEDNLPTRIDDNKFKKDDKVDKNGRGGQK